MSNQKTTRKPTYKKVVRVNITLPPKLHEASESVFTKFGFSGLSDYVQGRLRKDAGLELPS